MRESGFFIVLQRFCLQVCSINRCRIITAVPMTQPTCSQTVGRLSGGFRIILLPFRCGLPMRSPCPLPFPNDSLCLFLTSSPTALSLSLAEGTKQYFETDTLPSHSFNILSKRSHVCVKCWTWQLLQVKRASQGCCSGCARLKKMWITN